MIQLHRDYLLVETAPNEVIPCSAELIAVELLGQAGDSLDSALVQEAAAAVLHYFKEDLGWTTVTVGEFSRALVQALRALGISTDGPAAPKSRVRSVDLQQIASGAERELELSFFPQLRSVLHLTLGDAPEVVRFHGLRPCVKQLVGTKRWNQRCQGLQDQIVNYVRACLEAEGRSGSCEVVIR